MNMQAVLWCSAQTHLSFLSPCADPRGLQSGDTVWGFPLLFFVQLRRKFAVNSSLPKGFPSLADGFGDALRRRRGECLGLAPILAVG